MIAVDMFDGTFDPDSAAGGLPHNPLADLVGEYELRGALNDGLGDSLNDGLGDGLNDGLNGGLGRGLTVEYGGREYFVDEFNDTLDGGGKDSGNASANNTDSDSADSAAHSQNPNARASADESVTVADDRGMSILSDTDGDGKVDYVSSVSYDGQWSAWRWMGPGEAEGASPKNGGNTPNTGSESWQSDAWKCVDRGEWG